MEKSLVIVESPAKAKTLKKYLGKNFQVKATVGHIMNLPKSKLGVDIDAGFEPQFVLIKGKTDVLKELKSAAESADIIYLAPDPDREGEAIAAHVVEALKLGGKKKKQKVYRVMFHEITKNAVLKALTTPSEVNSNLVHAQQARRILDRLVGYQVSPILWKKVRRGLSAGRVQSVALRLVVEREREIQAFKPEEYWSIHAEFNAEPNASKFEAKLHQISGAKAEVKSKAEADTVLSAMGEPGAKYNVEDVQKKERKRNPVPPFITSSLQQEASVKLRFSPTKTMTIAQKLYEGVELGSEGAAGLITYMRTDSTRLSAEAIGEVRKFIEDTYKPTPAQKDYSYLPEKEIHYRARKGAQEGHEAIRPTSVFRTPESVSKFLAKDELALYRLIWQRFVACQMSPAIYDATTVDIVTGEYKFRATGSILKFHGFTKVYEAEFEKSDESDRLLPPLSAGDKVALGSKRGDQHFTQPPPRYSEAMLIKELEEKGIGRPSTYAGIMSIITSRDYAKNVERRLIPTELGLLVSELLTESFPDIFNVEFTAGMEDRLDDIESGKRNWVETLREFYSPFKKDLDRAETQMKDVKKEVEETDIECDKCGKKMVIKWGRFGKFLSCSGYPDCKNAKPLPKELGGTEQESNQPMTVETNEKCPACSAPMVIKIGRFGKFMACSRYPECKTTKPITTGVRCPEKDCTGELVERRSKRGKIFFSCSRYPDCKFATWDRPLNEKCPKCGYPFLTEKKKKGADTADLICGNHKECDYRRVKEDQSPA